MDEATLWNIVCLMQAQTYERGDNILKRYMANDRIMIIWEGEVQVRVERVDPDTGKPQSYWFDTLEKGACLSVYTCFGNSKSLVNLYAASVCTIQFIKTKDLEDLGKRNVALKERLNVIKLKIENSLVGDIDYFTFPKRLLQSEIEKHTEE